MMLWYFNPITILLSSSKDVGQNVNKAFFFPEFGSLELYSITHPPTPPPPTPLP